MNTSPTVAISPVVIEIDTTDIPLINYFLIIHLPQSLSPLAKLK